MKSIRARLLAGMTGSLALLLVIFGFVIYATIRLTLLKEFDFYLETVARTLAASVKTEGGQITVKLVPEALPELEAVEGELFSQYWTAQGTVLARSGNLGREDLPRFHGEAGEPAVRPLVLADGRRARAAGMRFRVTEAGGPPAPADLDAPDAHLTLVVARDTTDFEAHLRELRWLLLGSGTGVRAAGLAVSVAIIRRGLRPLRRLADEIAAVREDGLGAEIPAAAAEEIQPVVKRLNDLLRRLEAAFARERAFTADVAHELRTPLAGILTTAEVALASPRPADEYREALADIREIARRMGSMADTLRQLARLDAGAASMSLRPVHLKALVGEQWGPLRRRAGARGLRFENRLPEGLMCTAHRAGLATVLANLLDNCVEYADERGRVWAGGDATEQGVLLEVGNTGCRLGPHETDRVFERFWRGDAARHAPGRHTGLGLALVGRRIACQGGTVSADAAEGGPFVVRLRLRGA